MTDRFQTRPDVFSSQSETTEKPKGDCDLLKEDMVSLREDIYQKLQKSRKAIVTLLEIVYVIVALDFLSETTEKPKGDCDSLASSTTSLYFKPIRNYRKAERRL